MMIQILVKAFINHVVEIFDFLARFLLHLGFFLAVFARLNYLLRGSIQHYGSRDSPIWYIKVYVLDFGHFFGYFLVTFGCF